MLRKYLFNECMVSALGLSLQPSSHLGPSPPTHTQEAPYSLLRESCLPPQPLCQRCRALPFCCQGTHLTCRTPPPCSPQGQISWLSLKLLPIGQPWDSLPCSPMPKTIRAASQGKAVFFRWREGPGCPAQGHGKIFPYLEQTVSCRWGSLWRKRWTFRSGCCAGIWGSWCKTGG